MRFGAHFAGIAVAMCFAISPTHARHAHGIPLPFPQLLHPDTDPPLPDSIIGTAVTGGDARKITGPISRLDEVAGAIAPCWQTPPGISGQGAWVTMQLSFRANGTVLSQPFFTAASEPPGTRARAALVTAARQAVAACAPLPFTPALGSAIAGRQFFIRLIRAPKPSDKDNPI